MYRNWWFVWVRVGVLALALFLAFRFCWGKVDDLVSPYLIGDSQPTVSERADPDSEETDIIGKVTTMLNKVFDAEVDLENLIFDYANEYARRMVDRSYADRTINSPLK